MLTNKHKDIPCSPAEDDLIEECASFIKEVNFQEQYKTNVSKHTILWYNLNILTMLSVHQNITAVGYLLFNKQPICVVFRP